MKRNLILSALVTAVFSATPQTYHSCDFKNGIPADYTVADNDGLTPSVDMQRLGFAAGTGWIALADEGNGVASSTSWYDPSGTSDDWLITPSFKVTDSKAVLSWRARAFDKSFRDGYKVIVQAGESGEPSAFTNAPVFAVEHEEAGWTRHTVSLEAYAGQTVRVAFVNNSTDCSRLYIDDIYAGMKSFAMVTDAMPSIVTSDSPIHPEITLTNPGESAVKGDVTVTVTCGGESQTETLGGVNIAAGESAQFTLQSVITPRNNRTMPYTITISDGETEASTSGEITALVNRVVCEEMTGMWCGYCVRGIVMMEEMNKKYPDTFIGMAVHQGDPLSIDSYSPIFSFSSEGLPYMVMMRSRDSHGDPRQISSYYSYIIDRQPTVGVGVTAHTDADTRMVKATATLMFANDFSDLNYRLAWLVTENNVFHPDDDEYYQNNYYAGGELGEMGGFENLSKKLSADEIKFQDVPRGFAFDAYGGIENSVPSEGKALEAIESRVEFALPDNIDNLSECRLTCLVIDEDGKIVNAARVPLLGDPDGLTEAVADNSDARFSAVDGGISSAGLAEVETARVYRADGQLVAIITADGVTQLPAGFYIVACGGQSTKLIIK